MMKLKNTMVLLSILIAALALVLSGCGGSGDDSSKKSSSSSKYASQSSALTKSNAGGKEYIRASVDGELKEFGVASMAGVGGSTSITGNRDGDSGQESLKISMKGITSTGSYTVDNDMTVMYMGSDGTGVANTNSKQYGASFKVVIDDYDAYAVGTFSGTLVRVVPATGEFISIEVKDGEFSIPVRR